MNLFKPAAAALLASFLAACSLIPPAQQSSQRQAQAQVQTAADTGQKPPEKVTLPNMVTTTPLETNLPADKNDQLNAALEQALAEKPAEEGFRVQNQNLPQVFIVRFMAQAKNLKQQVKIPENGAFQLVLEAGSGKKLEILDGDGSDGQATIRLPQHTYEALLHLQGPWKPNSSLEVSDDLYYVKDTLSSKQGKLLDLNRWFLLGVRPLPVPSDWYNPDGQKLVLKFKTDTVKEFQMAWWTTNQQAAYPPGIRQIGPAGGIVELPGVGSFKLLPGALEQNITVSMRQVREINRPVYEFAEIEIENISPIVKIEPILQDLKEPGGEITLVTDLARLGNNSAGVLNYIHTKEPENVLSWKRMNRITPKTAAEYDNYPVNLPGLVGWFGYFVRVIDKTIQPNDHYISVPPQDARFQIQGNYDSVMAIHGYRNNPCKIDVSALDKPSTNRILAYCNEVFGHYVQLFHFADAQKYPRLLYEPSTFLTQDGYQEIQIKNEGAITIPANAIEGSSLVIIPSTFNTAIYPNNDSNYASVIAHELWHVFQNAGFSKININGTYGGTKPGSGIEISKQWLYEGAGEYMGASTMKKLKFGNSTYDRHYIEKTTNGIKALSTIPLYEFVPVIGSLDKFNYDACAFFTYLSHPQTYPDGDIIMAKMADYHSVQKPSGQYSEIQNAAGKGLAPFIQAEFEKIKTVQTKTLADHFFKFAHFAISKQRLDLFPASDVLIGAVPQNTTITVGKDWLVDNVSINENNLTWIVGHKNFEPYKKQHLIKSLSANYYKFAINKNNRSNRKFNIKIKANSVAPTSAQFRFSALLYKDIDQAPPGGDFDEKYALPPDDRVDGNSINGIDMFSPQGKTVVLAQDFNEKYQAVFFVMAGVNFLDRRQFPLDIEISFQATGTRSSSLDPIRTAIVEPKEPIRIADGSGGIPDPLLWDQLPKLAIHKVPGCLEENCKMAFEHMAGGPDIIVKVPPSRIINEETDSDGVTLQRISAVIPNHAKPGGRVRVLSDDIEIEVFGVTPVSCNSVQSNSSYVISNTLQNKPNTPCGKTQAKAP